MSTSRLTIQITHVKRTFIAILSNRSMPTEGQFQYTKAKMEWENDKKECISHTIMMHEENCALCVPSSQFHSSVYFQKKTENFRIQNIHYLFIFKQMPLPNTSDRIEIVKCVELDEFYSFLSLSSAVATNELTSIFFEMDASSVQRHVISL